MDDEAAALDRELHMVACWERSVRSNLTERRFDRMFCWPLRFINHTSPKSFVEQPLPQIRWSDKRIDSIGGAGLTALHGLRPRPRKKGPAVDNADLAAEDDPDYVEGTLARVDKRKTRKVNGPGAFIRPRRSKTVVRSAARSAEDGSTQIIFPWTPEDDRRLVLVIAVVRALTGGLEQGFRAINWGLVHQALDYMFDARYCRERWTHLKSRHALSVDKIQVRFRKLYVDAYEEAQLPELDLVYPENNDWPELVRWTESRIDAGDDGLWDLPQTRSQFDREFEVEVHPEPNEMDKDEYFNQLTTTLRREELANAFTFAVPLKQPSVPSTANPVLLAKSWIRASVLTAEAVFDQDEAQAKLVTLGDIHLRRAIDEMLGEKMIRHRVGSKGRRMPGRNYEVGEHVMAAFKRPWDQTFFQAASEYKSKLDTEFRTADGATVSLDYHAPDSHFMVVENLIAHSRATITADLPPINHEFDAPWPRLTKWGFTEGNYKTVHMDRERLQFGLKVSPSGSYIYGKPLRDLPIPLTKQFPNEPGPRLPFWTDINGDLMEEHRSLLLVSVLYLLAMRPGMTVRSISKAHKERVWDWEIELLLEWAEEVGLAKRVFDKQAKSTVTAVDGVNGVDADGDVQMNGLVDGAKDQDFGMGDIDAGWTTGEWWWMAFAAHK